MPPRFRVLIYCPDRHILYDDRTTEEVGVGGGITARIRMGRALARRGHEVVHVGNVSVEETVNGVRYTPLVSFAGGHFDIAVLTTSGDGLDLSPALDLDIQADLRIAWIHGPEKPISFEACEADYVYAVSRFIKEQVTMWAFPSERIVVQYNGYEPAHYDGIHDVPRDNHRLVYSGHPSKGLDHAIGVLARLRQRDGQFRLDIYGGPQLWGGVERSLSLPAGATYHGLIGQRALARAMLGSGFSLQLQARQEPGALAIPECQRAGCVIVASPVGVYRELVTDQVDGILVNGDPLDPQTHRLAAARIAKLTASPTVLDSFRVRASAAARDCDAAALDWERHWSTVPKLDREGY